MYGGYIAIAMSILSVAPAVSRGADGGVCLTTLAPNPAFVPPHPYPAIPSQSTFWYGSESLWTALPHGGTWGMADNVGGRKFYRTKLVYYHRGLDWRKEPQPDLIVTARRLDGDAPSVAVAHANAVFVTTDRPGIMTGIDIPTQGCWEITAYYAGHNLSFVVAVKP